MQKPTYHLPFTVLLEFLWFFIRGTRRSFRQDSLRLSKGVSKISILGEVPSLPPTKRGWLVLMNHYSRPGFHAWWSVIAVSSVFPQEIHWVMTSTWTYPDPIRTLLLSPILHLFFSRLASIYDFTTMPPMPPRPKEAQQRAAAVRQVAHYVRNSILPVVGLSPEGRDVGPQQIGEAPPGVGRWIHHLEKKGLALIPVGVYEDGPCLIIRVGSILNLDHDLPDFSKDQDRILSLKVMQSIAACLPSDFKNVA